MHIKDRIKVVGKILSKTEGVSISMYEKEFMVEYIIIPAMTNKGELKSPIFVYPGGGTHLGPCFEHLLYLDRRIIVISPLGYGRSSLAPDWLSEKDFLYGADVALLVLSALRVGDVEIFCHSNAAPVGGEILARAKSHGIEIKKLTLANPLGVRFISRISIALAFPIFGMLSRIFSLGYENPYKFLSGFYEPPESSQSRIQRICGIFYELNKSSKPRLAESLKKVEGPIGITVIQSKWDWASFRFPWGISNKAIFQEILQVSFYEIPGFHNSTLGRNSRHLAEAMMKDAEK